MSQKQNTRPTIITIVNQGSNWWAVQADTGAFLGGLTWDEMLAQVACLTAPADVEPRDVLKGPTTLTIVPHADVDGHSLLADGVSVARGIDFGAMLGEIVRRTFPPGRMPGAPLFFRGTPGQNVGATVGVARDEKRED